MAAGCNSAMFHVKHCRFIIVLAATLVVASCAQTQPSTNGNSKKVAATKEFTRAVPANAPIKLDDFFFANSACEAIDFTLQITRQPSNGQAIIQASSTTLSVGQAKSGNPSPKCMGRVIASKAVVYRPNNGYTGPDSFEARFANSRDPSRQKTVRYLLTIQ